MKTMYLAKTEDLTKLSQDLGNSSASHLFDKFPVPAIAIASVLVFAFTALAVWRIWQRRLRT